MITGSSPAAANVLLKEAVSKELSNTMNTKKTLRSRRSHYYLPAFCVLRVILCVLCAP